jgi:phenylalanyl-tRNA synthetase alpha chain
MSISTLNTKSLRQALNLRDLTDPDDGRHAMQNLIDDVLAALRDEWGCEIRIHRGSPIISVEENYNKLRYPPTARRVTLATRAMSRRTLCCAP